MAYSIIQQGDTVDYGIISATVNTRNDIDTLPKNWRSGSSVLCLEDSSVWMLSTEDGSSPKKWKEI